MGLAITDGGDQPIGEFSPTMAGGAASELFPTDRVVTRERSRVGVTYSVDDGEDAYFAARNGTLWFVLDRLPTVPPPYYITMCWEHTWNDVEASLDSVSFTLGAPASLSLNASFNNKTTFRTTGPVCTRVGVAGEWTRHVGTPQDDFVVGVAYRPGASGTDMLVVAGDTQGGIESVNNGDFDLFARRLWSESGTEREWTAQDGTPARERARDVAISPGGVIVVGATDGDFERRGEGNRGSFDALAWSLDNQGSTVWRRQFGTPGWDFATAVVVDPLTYGVIAGGETCRDLDGHPDPRGCDGFVHYMRADNGEEVWTISIDTEAEDSVADIATWATSTSTTIVVAGWTGGTLPEESSAGGEDAFVASLAAANGRVLWRTQLGSDKDDRAFGIATDADGNVYVCGWTAGDFEGASGEGNKGRLDVFVAKLRGTDGLVLWRRQRGTAADDRGFRLAVENRPSGNVVVVGRTGLDLGGPHKGENDVFMLTYDSLGNLLGRDQFGSKGDDYPFGVIFVGRPSEGHAVVVGFTSGGLDGNDNQGGVDGFVKRIRPRQ
jgi:hypothetical protein